MQAAISWSAGKDSCLALLRCRDRGIPVTTLVTMCEPDGTSKSHALTPELIAAQAAAFGVPWLPVRVPPGEYARTFDDVLRHLCEAGHTHMVFGDIDLQAHRDWLEPACRRAGLDPLFPLWGESRAALASEIVRRGIRARIVCVDAQRLDASICGADYDAALLEHLPRDVCPCGEEGEFHTFVFDAPGMVAPLRIVNGEQRTVASSPPLSPTTLVFRDLRLEAQTTTGK